MATSCAQRCWRTSITVWRVAQEADFGLVACLLPFKDEAEGLRLANHVETASRRTSGTQDVSRALRLACGIEAGMVFVNTQKCVRDLRQPFRWRASLRHRA
ncbi:aldehyde dehydrogenase family protein [Shigella flexneri]